MRTSLKLWNHLYYLGTTYCFSTVPILTKPHDTKASYQRRIFLFFSLRDKTFTAMLMAITTFWTWTVVLLTLAAVPATRAADDDNEFLLNVFSDVGPYVTHIYRHVGASRLT